MWTPAPDRALHFGAGNIATCFGYAFGALARRYGCTAPGWAHGIAFCLVAALAREAYNLARSGKWSWADISATMLGAAPVIAAAEVGP